VVWLSPVSITTRMPACPQRLQRGQGGGFDGIGDGQDARHLTVKPQIDRCGAVQAQRVGAGFQPRWC